MIDSIVEHITARLSAELPGENAHVQMAPIHRPSPQEARNWDDTKFASVLILLYPKDGAVYTSLMMRPDYDGVHSRQVSFPGGRKEKEDADVRQTALREAHEELNINPQDVEVFGELSELYIPPSKSLVTPVLGFSQKRPDFIPDEKEVGEIIEAKFLDLIDDRYYSTTKVIGKNYVLREVPAILYNGYTIWGATAMMLNEMKWLMESFDS